MSPHQPSHLDGSIRLICNPASQSGRNKESIPQALASLKALDLDVELMETTCIEDGYRFAREAAPGSLVLSLGGDGLHAVVAGGCADSGAIMYPLPGGRGNDFVRSLDGSRDLAVQVSRLLTVQEARIDLGVCRSLNEDISAAPGRSAGKLAPNTLEEHTFLGVVSVGFDTLANTYANEPIPLMKGRAAYAFGAVRAVKDSRSQLFRVVIDGEEHEVLARTVAVGQSGRYGGGMKICPEAQPDDGQLDVTVIGDVSIRQFPRLLRDVFAGRHLNNPNVYSFRGSRIEVHTDGPITLAFGDGDPVGELPVEITVRDKALRILR